MKFRDVLKGSILEDRLNILVDDAKNKRLRDLGKNDCIHSNNIENYLDQLVPDDIKVDENIFDKGEIFLLLCAVYLHDIGRTEDGDHHEKETYEKIMRSPAKYGFKNEFEANAVAEICYGHAKESEKPIKSIRTDYGIAGLSNKPLNLQFLSALLRLTDEVDNTFIRVQGVGGQKDSIRNLIRFINFDQSRWIIEIQSEPASWKDWSEIKKMRNYIQIRLDEIKDILELKGLLYYQIWLDPNDSLKIKQSERPKNIELEDFKQFVGTLISEEPYYNKKFSDHTVDIYFEDVSNGQSYRNVAFVHKEFDEEQIYECKEIFNNLRSNDEIEQGFVVVKTITEEVIRVSKRENLKVITVRDLLQNCANFSDYLCNYLKDYEDTEIFKKDCYIPLTGNVETKEDVGIIDDYLDTWLNSEGQLQLTILGDYGTGKSTIAKNVAYRQAKKYLANPEKERIPILIELKIYQKSISIESLITDLLINKYCVEIKNYNAFKHLNESGKLLLILDGFDEMASRVDFKVTLANFREFDKLISENAKVILTCRTHYFKNQDEIHKLHEGTEIYKKIDKKGGYDFLFLNPFTEKDFITYLKKFFPDNWEKYYQTIINTYNLRELAEKPILLELMVQTLPQIKIEENETLNHASLYDRYTKFWLNRDDWRSYLKSDEREFITEEIAFYLFSNDKDRIFHEDLPKIIKAKFPDKGHFEMEYLDQDVRTCTFLNRNEEGDYSFVHQSFMEFFVAKKFANEIKTKNSTNFELKQLSPEIAGFLMNLIDEFDIFHEYLKSTKNKSFDEVKYLGGNSATILNLHEEDLSKMDLSSTFLIGANFNNAKLINANLNNAVFSMQKTTQPKNIRQKNKEKQLESHFINIIKQVRFFISHKDEINLIPNALKIRKNIYELKNLINIIPTTIYQFSSITKLNLTIDDLLLNDISLHNLLEFEKHCIKFLDEISDLSATKYSNNNTYIVENKNTLMSENVVVSTFVNANLQGADISNCDLKGFDFREANLKGAKLIEANLSGVNFTKANLNEVDFTRSDLRGNDLREANLKGAKLFRTNLSRANLKKADLEDADLREAILIGANLIDVKKANMFGAVR